MFCPNCCKELNNNEKFCTNCGVKTIKEEINNVSNINSEINIKKSNNKKLIILSISIILIFIMIFMLFAHFYGFDELSWDNTYSDNELEYVSPTTIKLGIKFDNEEKINEIKYDVTCGEVKNNGTKIEWNLEGTTGKCKITAAYKLRKISKEYTIIKYNINEEDLMLENKINLDSDEDLDFDGLTNKEEKQYNTNPEIYDTDMDGLDDKYEIFTSKTDPNKKDTDGDGLNDFDEIELKLEPLKSDSKGDGLSDGSRTLTYNYSSNNLTLSITGTGNIASTVANVNSNTKISSKTGLIDNLYTFYTDGNIDEAIVTIPYTTEDLKKYNIDENNLSIYYYNEKESKYEKVETTINKTNKTLTATLKHFSNYVVGDSTIVKETSISEVLFILDNSWSMYTNEQYKEITGKEYSGGIFSSKLDGFDSSGIRFTLTSNLITSLSTKNYKLGLSEFRSDYANALKIGSDAESLKTKLTTMNGSFITSKEGTNISNALTNGIKEFSEDSDYKYIVILTDGQDSSLKNQEEKIIEKAVDSDVKICSIGFGGGSYNTELSNISNATGCKFYSSGNVTGLDELFENIESEINDDLVDIDGDNETDGILIADSDFIVNRDGFSFPNYTTNYTDGHCYGMATVAQLYYKNSLPLKVDEKTIGDDKSNAYNLTNTFFSKNNNLYDYKLKTNILKHTFGFEYFNEEIPADLRKLDGTYLAFNDTYKTEIEDSGLYDINIQETELSKDAQIEKWGVNYKTADNTLFNEDKMQNSSGITNEEKQLLNAIYTSFIKQFATTHYSSGTSFILWARTVIGSEDVDYPGAQGFINVLKSRLDDKDAPVISASFSGGLHAVNAINLIQDSENANHYYIGVYDNNYPGEKRYVDVECNKNSCLTVANDYYTSSGEPIRITPSLEYDLDYYK